jgi:hypothetical protein
MDPSKYPAPNIGCLAPGKCHAGIEPSRSARPSYSSPNETEGISLNPDIPLP